MADAGSVRSSASFLANKGDDLGRPIVLHKPLNKGEYTQTSLSKVFDDPGMRPKAFGSREPVNKPHSALQTADIYGATAKPTPKARGTNPAVPVYKLPSAEPVVSIPLSSTRPWSARTSKEQGPSEETLAAAAELRPARDSIGVGDIEGTRPKLPYRPLSAQPLRTATLDASDIEGAQPGWKPHFRAHVGVNLRDPGLDVSDINNYHLPKSHKTLFQGAQSMEQQQAARSAAAEQQAMQVQVQAEQQAQARAAAQPGLPTGFQYTGLPVFQGPPAAVDQQVAGGGGGAGGDAALFDLASEQQAEMWKVNAELATARQAQRCSHSAVGQHVARVAIAEQRDAARQAANTVVSQLSLNRTAVETLWDACRGSDRQRCGKITISELARAFDAAGVQRSADQMRALVTGLQDNAGLLPYRDLAKVLLIKSMQPGTDPKLFPTHSKPPRPASAKGSTAAASPAKPHRPVSARPILTSTPSAAAPVPAAAPTAASAPASAGPELTFAQMPQQQRTEYSPRDAGYGAAGPAVAWADPVAAPAAPSAARPLTAAPQPALQPQTLSAQGQGQQLAQAPGQVQGRGAGEPESTFLPYKANAFWFSGVEPPETLQQEAAAWKVRADLTHAVTAYHVGEDIAAAAAPPAEVTAAPAWPRPVTQPLTSGLPNAPTTSSLLKSGRLSGAELAEQLKSRHTPRPASAPRGRAVPAHQIQLLAAPPSGASLGVQLKGTLVPVGTGALHFGALGTSVRAAGRPSSARPAGGRADASFSAVAQSKGGPSMDKLHHQMLKSDIAAVRMLY